jgi:hypothetical protein
MQNDFFRPHPGRQPTKPLKFWREPIPNFSFNALLGVKNLKADAMRGRATTEAERYGHSARGASIGQSFFFGKHYAIFWRPKLDEKSASAFGPTSAVRLS